MGIKRKILKFEKVKRGHRSKSEKWGVCKSKRVQEKDILITGTGRCGTRWLHLVLNQCGLEVGHEVVHRDGTVSWYFCVDSDWYPMHPWRLKERKAHIGERRSDFNFAFKIHIVREPLACITSMNSIMQSIDHEFCEENGIIRRDIEPKLLRTAHMYYGINLAIEEQTHHRFKIENLWKNSPKEFQRLFRAIKYPCPKKIPKIKQTNKASGYYKKPKIKWSELKKLDPKFTQELQRMSQRYGYESS